MSTIRDELVPVVIVGTILGVYAYQVLTGSPVPQALESLLSLVVGFYFGSKATVVGRANGAR